MSIRPLGEIELDEQSDMRPEQKRTIRRTLDGPGYSAWRGKRLVLRV
jgi:hypothetical protein